MNATTAVADFRKSAVTYLLLSMVSVLLLTSAAAGGSADAAEPPLDLGDQHASTPGAPNYANAAVTLPDGTLESFYRRAADGHVSIFVMRSTDSGRSWTTPAVLVHLSIDSWGGPMPLLDRDGELHFVIPRVRGDGRRPGVDRFIDLYHLRSFDGRTRFSEPKRIYEGYCGALQGVFQLSSGRIVAPFADWLPGVPTKPPTGPSVTTCVYSDDAGQTWHRSPAALTAPCHDGYNGGNYGACEPTIIELQDGRVWMLIRTQDGFLYESFSPDGVHWSDARRSRFYSSNSPAFPVRLPDGRLVVFWNNCQMPPRVGNDGVYGGRDALHAAISSDEGQTWRGFREVYRDATRNGSPPKDGDRGTAYPHATVTSDGKILLVSGQGTNRRRRFLIDPDWLLETSQTEDFQTLDAWHVFTGFGPAQRWWRDRFQGPQLISHPSDPDRQVLHIRRSDERAADGAVWNFPAGRAGELVLRLRIGAGFGGARISLTDRMFEPCDDQADELAAVSLLLEDGGALAPDRWHDLRLTWKDDLCDVAVDGQPLTKLRFRHPAPDGLSYLRLRSTAGRPDPIGFLVESVRVTIR
ncbi:MAG: sialidase family protein [Fuerstiella sp.]